MIIKAKFPSTCSACQQQVRIGEDVDWEPGHKTKHVKCPAPGEAQKPIPPSFPKTPFILALESVSQPSIPSVPLPRLSARDHLVAMMVAHGERPSSITLPEGYELCVLTVNPQGVPVERVLYRPGVEALYVRSNAGANIDTRVNNTNGGLVWRIKWSPVVQMAIEGLRFNPT